EVAARLRAVTLAPRPAPGRQLPLDFETIKSRLAAKGFNLTELEFVGHSETIVTSPQRPAERPQAPRTPAPPLRVSESQRRTVEDAIAAAVTKAIHRRSPEFGKVSVDAEVRANQLPLLLSADIDGYASDGGRPPFAEAQLFEIRFTDREGAPQ